MPRTDAAQVLANNLHSLAHPDGRPRRLMHFSQFGRDEKTAANVASVAGDLGIAAVHTLELHGYTINHKDDPKPADADGYKQVAIRCLACGKQLASIGVDENLTANFTRIALKSFTAINPVCPHE